MSPEVSDLERLISRVLDREASPAEQERLGAHLDQNPQARRLYDEYATLDRQVGATLRAAVARRPQPRRRPWTLTLAANLGALGAAAALALAIGHQPGPRAAEPGGRAPAQASWFAPSVPAADVVEQPSPTHERPQLRLRDRSKEWIVIPGDKPGEFFLIEVDRTKTQSIGIHQDF